jgi:hypothetical protein
VRDHRDQQSFVMMEQVVLQTSVRDVPRHRGHLRSTGSGVLIHTWMCIARRYTERYRKPEPEADQHAHAG